MSISMGSGIGSGGGSGSVLTYKGNWNALINSPEITSSVGVEENYYIVTTSGNTNIDGTSDWFVKDWIVFSSGKWRKISGGQVQGQTISYQAGEIISQYQFVYLNNNAVWISGSNIPASRNKTIGIAINSALIGEPVTVITIGEVLNLSWSLGSGGVIYLISNGSFDIIPSLVGGEYSQQVGFIKNSQTVYIQIDSTTIRNS